MKLKSSLQAGLVLLTLFSSSSFAVENVSKGVDLTQMTNGVNFDSVLVGVLAVGGSLVALYGGFAGVRWILRMVKGA
ncbi:MULTISPECIES: hypothetical protein [Proteus]|uniref:hypothetical protein n=1 Tax=Proteus TaxID=583 RepID=UPI00235FCD1C|nr:hypothetical protein [Proteus vulgaris]